MRNRTLTLLAVAATLLFGGCKDKKSSNPLSPSVAGPISGVTITAPKAVSPTTGTEISVSKQPITLTIENATTSGQRSLTYRFEVALDSGFANKVVTREGIAAGTAKTSFTLPDSLAAEKTYYWRARAQDGANTGEYLSAVNFSVYTPIVLQAPQLVSPVDGVTVANLTPTLKVTNAARTGPVTSISYQFQISKTSSFSSIVTTLTKTEAVSSTAATSGTLSYGLKYYWRARAIETKENVTGPWSSTEAFMTPAAPSDPGSGDGGGGGVDTTTWPTNGPALVKFIAAKYPSYLAAGVSSSKRVSNMDFLRDRMIEAGNCGGMKLAWNLKRGGPTISHDYLVWYTSGRWVGVDIAQGYDDTSVALRLHWLVLYSDTYATYGGYTNTYSCK